MTRRISLLPLVLLPLVAAACGGTTPDDESATSPPTTAETTSDIEVGGRTLHLVCAGSAARGTPTVVLEAGLGGDHFVWGDRMITGIAARTRVCAYDRAGLGLSPAAEGRSRTSADMVADLATMLEAADVAGPYLMVGHSNGAWQVALFTEAHPDDVVGVVLIDPRAPEVSANWLAALPPVPSSGEDPVRPMREELTDFEQDPAANPDHMDLIASAAEAAGALGASGELFGDRPLVVLGAQDTPDGWDDLPDDTEPAFDAAWLAGQKALAAESTNGSFIPVADSGHEVFRDQPTVVVDTILTMLDEIGS
jgi:pimeloyl-ACP methyl ester carboxylesterase